MERKVYQELLDWKQKKGRKPLILTGARQVGKTWLMQEFGRREYSKTLYVNFDLDERLQGLFDHDYDIPRILMTLQALTGVKATIYQPLSCSFLTWACWAHSVRLLPT